MHVQQDIRDLKRLEKILVVFFEEGLGYYITQSKLSAHLPFLKRFRTGTPIPDTQAQAIHLRQAFERLGPTFVKLGQLLSLRPDLVPEEYCSEFEKLQDKVPSFPFAQVKTMLEEDLHQPISTLFTSINPKPLASASIAQVHQAVLKTGQKVVLKVQRPNIKESIDADLDILFLLAHSLEKHYPQLRNYRPVEVVREFALWTRKELNFEIEARNAMRLREELKENRKVRVPKIYQQYSSKRILTMDFMEGVKIDNLPALKHLHLNQQKIALTYFTSILEQALLYGFFHADPHPANIFVQKDGKLVYLDYGIMGELNAADRRNVIRFIRSVPDKNPDKSLDIVIALARDTTNADLGEFKRRTLPIMEDVYTHSIKERSFGHALYEVISLGAQYGVLFDPNHVLMAKALYQAEGLGLKLDPHFKVAEGLRIFADEYLRKTYSPLAIAREVQKTVIAQKDLLLELPYHIQKIMERLEKPEANDHISIFQLHELEHEMELASRRKNIGLVVCFFIIGGSFLLYLEGRRDIIGVPLSVILFLLALGLFIYSLFIHIKEQTEGRAI